MAVAEKKSKPEPNSPETRAIKFTNIPNEPRVLCSLEKGVHTIGNVVSAISILGLIGIVGITCVDVIGGKFFDSPFPGYTGILGMAQLIAMSFAMGITFSTGHHIKVELFLHRFPPRLQAVVKSFTALSGFVIFGLIIWRMIVLGLSFQTSGQVLDMTFIPFYPFVYASAFAFVPVCLGLGVDFLKSIHALLHKEVRTEALSAAKCTDPCEPLFP